MVAAALRHSPRLPEYATASPPSAGFLRVVALGHGTVASTWLWSSTVASYGERRATTPELIISVRNCGALDPRWKAPWVYGSTMVRSLADIPGHERLLADAMEAHPDEPWFPYMLGMSRYLEGDKNGATQFLDQAAELSDASEVHIHPARAIRER